jgi:hypothetical protein
MPRLVSHFVLFLWATASACSSPTECETAEATLNRCDAENSAVLSVASYQRIPLHFQGECSGVAACTASCVNGTSCPTINWVEHQAGVTDPDAPPAPKDAGVFSACLQKCFEQAH